MKQKRLLHLLLLCCFIFTIGTVKAIDLTDAGVVTYPQFTDTAVVVSGKTLLHLTSSTPLVNSTVDLQSPDSWLYLDAVRPSAAITQYINTKKITINGNSVVLKLGADNANGSQNARIAIYGQGAVIIPSGNLSDNNALQVFTEPNFGGNSTSYPIYTRNTNLGTFNNAIRSFKLKKGYMATLANQVDGTGFSKVFIADAADLEMPAMPRGLEATVSFIRVMRWDWNSQKGWAGGGSDVNTSNSTSFYDWNVAGDVTSPNYNYATIKQKLTWPSFTDIQNKMNVNHLLGLNEPEHPEQHQDDNGGKAVTVDQAINLWPGMMASGFRLGSPAPTDFSWLYNFVSECDKRNYRVDFVAIHAYWYTSTSSWRSQLQAVWNNTKRPIWITEWNNGANWTTETWPTADRSYSTANATKQLNDIKGIIGVMEDSTVHVERYFIYNWVQDARAMILNGSLTLAGAWYSDNPSKIAYRGAYDHQWKLVLPTFTATQSTTNPSQYTFAWKDYNRETAIGYILQKYDNSTFTWSDSGDTIPAIRTDAGASSDAAVPTISTTGILTQSTYYRVKAIGYEGSIVYSSPVQITISAVADAPVVTATPASYSQISLKWNAVANAQSYRVYKATYPDSVTFVVLRSSTTSTSYDDNFNLTPNTLYWYKVTSLNNGGESAATPVRAITDKLDGTPGDDPTTAIEWIATDNFKFYPNPVKAGQQIFVEGENLAGKINVKIMDMTGRTVLQFDDNKYVYAPQTKGIFFLKVVSLQKIEVCKLIVE